MEFIAPRWADKLLRQGCCPDVRDRSRLDMGLLATDCLRVIGGLGGLGGFRVVGGLGELGVL